MFSRGFVVIGWLVLCLCARAFDESVNEISLHKTMRDATDADADNLTLTRASDAPKHCRIAAANFNADEWPERGHAAGFLGIKSAEERRATHRRTERLILLEREDVDVAVGSVVIADSCAVVGEPEGTANVTLNGLVVARERRGRGFGEALTREAARFAFDEMGAGVVTVWCEPKLVGFYVEKCGFEYEEPRRIGFVDDDLDVCCRLRVGDWRRSS
jgi:ribosomal protein S18 acetylase RimI-like enzyme